MASIRFTGHLRRYFPGLEEGALDAGTVREVLQQLEVRHPGLLSYLLDDQGALRKHVNIFVDKQQLRDRTRQGDVLRADSEVFIVQALSGG